MQTAAPPQGFVLVPELMAVAETATRLRKSEKQLRWMIHAGTAPPSALIGGRRAFRTIDVEKFIDEKINTTTS